MTVTIPGGGGGTPFDLFNDVSDTVTTLTPGDWLLAADVSITGEPNVRVGFGDLVETIRPTIYDETTELVVSPSPSHVYWCSGDHGTWHQGRLSLMDVAHVRLSMLM